MLHLGFWPAGSASVPHRCWRWPCHKHVGFDLFACSGYKPSEIFLCFLDHAWTFLGDSEITGPCFRRLETVAGWGCTFDKLFPCLCFRRLCLDFFGPMSWIHVDASTMWERKEVVARNTQCSWPWMRLSACAARNNVGMQSATNGLGGLASTSSLSHVKAHAESSSNLYYSLSDRSQRSNCRMLD